MAITTSQPAQTSPRQSLLVYIRTPEEIVFQGETTALSSVNDQGPFDILSAHENFISIIKEKVIVHLLDGKTKEFPIKSGVLKTETNKVYIFLGISNLTEVGGKKIM